MGGLATRDVPMERCMCGAHGAFRMSKGPTAGAWCRTHVPEDYLGDPERPLKPTIHRILEDIVKDEAPALAGERSNCPF